MNGIGDAIALRFSQETNVAKVHAQQWNGGPAQQFSGTQNGAVAAYNNGALNIGNRHIVLKNGNGVKIGGNGGNRRADV